LSQPAVNGLEKLRQWRPSRRLVITVGIGSLVIWGGLQILPSFIDKNALKLSIEEGINDATGLNIHIRDLSIHPTIFHNLQLDLATNTITDKNKHPLGSIQNITVEVRYLPLLTKLTPEISKIHLNRVDVPIANYSLFKALKLQTVPPKQTGIIKPAQLVDTELLLSDFKIIDLLPDKTAALLLARSLGQPITKGDGAAKAMLFYIEGPTLSIHHLQSNMDVVMLGEGSMAFSKENVRPRTQLWQADFNFETALDQNALKEGHAIAAADLKHLVLKLKGQNQNYKASTPQLNAIDKALKAGQISLDTHYDRRNNGNLDFVWNRKASQADGVLGADYTSLAHAQAILLQLANVFSVEAPLPARSILLSGLMKSDVGFNMNFHKPAQPFEKLSGAIQLTHVAVEQNGGNPLPQLNEFNGSIVGQDDRFVLKSNSLQNPDPGLGFHVANIPLRLQGFYKLDDAQMDFHLLGNEIALNRLQSAAKNYIPKTTPAFDTPGTLSLDAHLWGSPSNPLYSGQLKLNGVAFNDPKLGLSVSGISGQASFKGSGADKKAHLSYQGQLSVKQGQAFGPVTKGSHIIAAATPKATVSNQTTGITSATISPAKPQLSQPKTTAPESLKPPSTNTSGTQAPVSINAGGAAPIPAPQKLAYNSNRAWAIHSINGLVSAKGNWKASDAKPALPLVNGHINFSHGEASIPNTKTTAQNIQGEVDFQNKTITLKQASAEIAKQKLLAQGSSSIDFKNYQGRLWGQALSIPVLSNAFLPSLKSEQKVQIKQGVANINIQVRNSNTPLKPLINGTATVDHLSVDTAQANRAISFPHLAAKFTQSDLSLEPATLLYKDTHTSSSDGIGTIAVELAGQMHFSSNGHYDLNLNSDAIPLALLRDLQAFAKIGGNNAIPEIWNTAGTLDLKAHLTQANKQVHLTFHDAGLSWQWGDFPVYGINGAVFLSQSGDAIPALSTTDLHFIYGRSPISLELQNDKAFNFNTRGILSALAVNHYLVSPQSDATPYHDIAFKAEAHGARLEAIPEKNNLDLALHVNLGRALRKASQDISSDTPSPKPVDNYPVDFVAVESRRKRILQAINPLHWIGKAFGVVNSSLSNSAHFISQIGETRPHDDEHTAKSDPTLEVEDKQATFKPSKQETEKLQKVADRETQILPSTAAPATAPSADSDKALFDLIAHWQGGNLAIPNATLHLFDAGNVLMHGQVWQPLKPKRMRYQVQVATQAPLQLTGLANATDDDGLFKKASGQVSTDMTVTQNIGANGMPHISGWAKVDDVKMPTLTIQKANGRVDLSGQSAIINLGPVELPGIKIVKASAQSENIFESPMTLEKVAIHLKQLDMAGISSFNNQIFKPIITDRIAHNYLRPWQLGDPILPIQFRNADLLSDEMIYSNILMDDLQSKLSVYANGFCELSNTSVNAAGGKASGYLSMNSNDNNFTTLDLHVDSVKANALTKALLNQTNQVFGDISGAIRFTTFGANDDALQKNANGTVTMVIKNGRLPAIAKVETLLTTANVLRGGLLGFNLNNLFRSLTIYDTNYFATLAGSMQINNQVLYTRNLTSDGVNLDLLIRGSMRMDTGDADMQVNGQMSQDVVGKLGFLGQLSLGKIVRFIPGIGSLGKNNAGLFGYLPGIGFVPGFGGPAGSENRFQVLIKGQLENPRAIKDFHWVHNTHEASKSPYSAQTVLNGMKNQTQVAPPFSLPFIKQLSKQETKQQEKKEAAPNQN